MLRIQARVSDIRAAELQGSKQSPIGSPKTQQIGKDPEADQNAGGVIHKKAELAGQVTGN